MPLYMTTLLLWYSKTFLSKIITNPLLVFNASVSALSFDLHVSVVLYACIESLIMRPENCFPLCNYVCTLISNVAKEDSEVSLTQPKTSKYQGGVGFLNFEGSLRLFFLCFCQCPLCSFTLISFLLR